MDDLARQTAERMGFIYWPGGDEPPADWDGGPYLCRDGGVYHMRGYDWRHGTGCWNPTADWDRIGYKARAALSSAIGEPYEFSGWVEVVDEGESP